LSVGKTTVDENIMRVACRCVGVLGGVCLCWVVVGLLTGVWCGVLVVWGVPVGCSTSDVGMRCVLFPGVLFTFYVLVWSGVTVIVTVTSLSLCIFSCGLPSADLFREFSGCGTWLFSPYRFLRGVTVFTYFRGEYVLWSGVVCPRAWSLRWF
jgi:hypothetical protein